MLQCSRYTDVDDRFFRERFLDDNFEMYVRKLSPKWLWPIFHQNNSWNTTSLSLCHQKSTSSLWPIHREREVIKISFHCLTIIWMFRVLTFESMIDLNRSRLCGIDRRFPRCSDRGPPCAGKIFCILFWKCFFCECIADLNRFRSCCMHRRFPSCLYLRGWIRRHLTWFILSTRWVSSFRWLSRTFFTISRLNDTWYLF